MATYTLNVNDMVYTVDAEPAMLLLWVLRDLLNLTGTKFGCGIGACSICTVLMDGQAIQSCLLPVSATVNHDITTIEAPGRESIHPVQEAWMKESVSQCGYCQPGKILNTIALLDKNPHPSDAEIDEAFKDHLCRCGTYQRIRRAVHRAAEGG